MAKTATARKRRKSEGEGQGPRPRVDNFYDQTLRARRFRAGHARKISHTLRTRVDIATEGMLKLPAYFDSQRQAAATLKIDISELREAKAEGCPAFRSGRVYTAPLLAWLAEKRQRHADLAATETADGVFDPGLVDHSEKNAELSKSHWDRKKARLDYERALYRFESRKKSMLNSMRSRSLSGRCS